METNKPDKKKLIIMLVPVILSGMTYLLFFGKRENIPAKENSEAFIIPNSSSEDIPESKAEVYKKEGERERKKQRENEESQISSAYFYSLGGNTEKEEGKEQLSQKESIEKISELLPAPEEATRRQTARPKAEKKKWESSEVEDPLAPYKNFSGEKKKEERNTPVPETPAAELPGKNAMPENTPGMRTRNNTISPTNPETAGLIAAAIHDDQTITNGSTVKMRLRQNIYINGEKIPANSFIYGIARFSNERVIIKLENIRIARTIYPFSKSVIDQDGIEGLFFPVNLKNQMGTEMGNEGIDEIFNRATAGGGVIGDVISAGKSALKRKASEKKVTLKANYKIFLK